ncbi:MAG: hypothetical protein H0V30_01290 [Chitinophagaceae bacterium]|nr:hypothetical protein [Chitinophagaceae bacterium]
MMVWIISLICNKIARFIICCCLVLITGSCNEKYTLTAFTQLTHFPSGSGIEFKRDHYYLAGDDANYLLKLDKDWKVVDSIILSTHPGKRISKNVKSDIEATTFLFGSRNNLFLFGSGSLSPYRDSMIVLNVDSNQKTTYPLSVFHQRLQRAGINEINIEGAASTPWGLLLSNRGNQKHPKNHLVFTSNDFFEDQEEAEFQIASIGINSDTTAPFTGISGLCYSGLSDRLLLTVSTEDTESSYSDGEIGKSYLWIVEDISSKRRFKGMNPNQVIDLVKIDKRFIGQKIESVSITHETNKILEVVLVADNDNGETGLFKLLIQKK